MSVLLDVQDSDCIASGIADFVAPDLGTLDQLIDAEGEVSGPYTVDGRRFVLGSVELAAAVFGGERLVIGSDGAWILIAPASALKLQTMETPYGHTVWVFSGESASKDASCGE